MRVIKSVLFTFHEEPQPSGESRTVSTMTVNYENGEVGIHVNRDNLCFHEFWGDTIAADLEAVDKNIPTATLES